DLGAVAVSDLGGVEQLFAALHAARTGGDDEAPVACLDVADHHERIVVPELTGRQFVRFRDPDDGLDTRHGREAFTDVLSWRGADGADERALLTVADVRGEAELSHLVDDALH